MLRELFTRIVEEVTLYSAYFCHNIHRTREVMSILMKCISAIRQLAYDIVRDALDEYLLGVVWLSEAYKGQYCKRVHGLNPFILLDDVVSQDLKWVTLVKSISNLADSDHKRIRYKGMHEASRKDVKLAFSALEKKLVCAAGYKDTTAAELQLLEDLLLSRG
ncbi:hypothetical protein Tco_0390082 [Tanacetum coccineum]